MMGGDPDDLAIVRCDSKGFLQTFHDAVAPGEVLHHPHSLCSRRRKQALNRLALIAPDLYDEPAARLQHPQDLAGQQAIGVQPVLAAVQGDARP